MQLGVFLGAAVLLAVTPGQGIAYVLGAARVRHRFGRLLTVGSGCSLIGLGAYVAVAKVER